MQSSTYRRARTQVRLYRFEQRALQEHAVAMECCDCDDVLQLGIDAFLWIVRADQWAHEPPQADGRPILDTIEQEIFKLYENWLGPCEVVEKWIHDLIARGYRPENLEQFHECCAKAQATVESRALAKLSFETLVNSGESW